MKRIIVATLAMLIVVVAAACNQNTVAALVTELGTASSSIASLEGSTALAAKLKTDTAAASTAVLNWKKGSASTEIVEALNIVETDLNLFPITDQYAPLIDLSIGTIESIMEIVQPGSSSTDGVTARVGVTHRVYLAKPPKNADQFKTAWNGIIAANPSMATSAMQ